MANENLTCNITTALANVTSACSATQLSELAFAATDNSDTNRQVSVATSVDLPDLLLNNIPEGTIMFLENYNVPVIATKTSWEGLDGQVIRKDVPDYYLWGWGSNVFCQLGDGTGVNKCSPVSVIGGINDWCDVAVSDISGVAIRKNGTLWAWGNGGSGQLGSGVTTATLSPVSVVGGFTDWCNISAEGRSTTAVRSNGSLWVWGFNNFGQLGDGTTVAKSSPISVIGGFADWYKISMGVCTSLGLRSNGTIWSWGLNNCGQLGNNTTVNVSSPVSVVGGFNDWCQISTGKTHSTGVRSNGTAWAWGENFRGQLGSNTNIAASSPVSVTGNFNDWTQVVAGCLHTMGLRANGTAWGWGYARFGKLGNGTTTPNLSSPVSVIGGFTDWCHISTGQEQTFIVRTNGTAWASGHNGVGTLGDGTTLHRSSPVSIVGGFNTWQKISTATTDSFAIGIVAV